MHGGAGGDTTSPVLLKGVGFGGVGVGWGEGGLASVQMARWPGNLFACGNMTSVK